MYCVWVTSRCGCNDRLARAEIIFEYITRELSEIHDCYVVEAVQSGDDVI